MDDVLEIQNAEFDVVRGNAFEVDDPLREVVDSRQDDSSWVRGRSWTYSATLLTSVCASNDPNSSTNPLFAIRRRSHSQACHPRRKNSCGSCSFCVPFGCSLRPAKLRRSVARDGVLQKDFTDLNLASSLAAGANGFQPVPYSRGSSREHERSMEWSDPLPRPVRR